MDKHLRLNMLYDYYKDLFTDKQKLYFEEYYYSNLSLSEIAENYDVSRNAVYHQLKIVEDRLEEFESILGLKEKKDKVIELLTNNVDKNILEIVELL